ncbi:FecR domain-containing protein [Bradyrhizobium sp. Arg237L]|uniref:FecR family protein n=1 Tax=Bradyrhizobium sp. Arg237L TaxID=3003352 RepID=UPI00249F1E3C|nr:FecR domain-containing protein [Bradyrhizobium sp. Arg237L]MDI4231966.1 FecR domain-containing protein [Bradyrhizobium sp. Arg237L]
MMKDLEATHSDPKPPALIRGASDPSLRAEALGWLRLLHSGQATAGDVVAFEHWRAISPAHAAEFAEASLLWTVLRDAAHQAERASATTPVGATVMRPNFRPSRRGFLIGGAALAASAAGVAVVRPPLDLWPSAMELAADYRTGIGERRQVDLHDKVAVELNTRTSLDVRSPRDGDVQLELLAGEAAIANRPGQAAYITVLAGSGRVMTGSASFVIRKTGSDVRVNCIEGHVDVMCHDKAFTLASGQQVKYDANSNGDVAAADPELVTAWQRGLLVFRRAPLADVIDEVNRYRAGRVVLLDAALARRQVVANFRLDRIDDVIDFISKAMDLRVRTLPGGVVLVG